MNIPIEIRDLLKAKSNRQNKYGNHKVHCLSKHLHDSKLEANYCNRLLAMKQSGDIHDYKIQYKFSMYVNCIHICDHIVDFYICFKINDPFEVHDTKGMKTDVWRIKYKLFQACYPDVKYIVVEKN